MRITAENISIGSGIAAALPPVSFSFADGDPVVVAVDTADRPTVLALAVTGRMRLDGGRVLVDGEEQPDALRRATALVDAPTVAEPSEVLPTRNVLREELVLAGQPAGSPDVERLLRSVGAEAFSRKPFGSLPGALRTRLLAETAAARPDVQALVITSPERYGGDPDELARLISQLSDRGFAALTLTSAAMSAALDRTHS